MVNFKLYIGIFYPSFSIFKRLIILIYNLKSVLDVKKKDDLIYDLIFSEQTLFTIDISEYIDDIYQYKEFVQEIKKILRKSKVRVSESDVVIGSRTVIWKLKVNK
jgi:hypothetical protein